MSFNSMGSNCKEAPATQTEQTVLDDMRRMKYYDVLRCVIELRLYGLLEDTTYNTVIKKLNKRLAPPELKSATWGDEDKGVDV